MQPVAVMLPRLPWAGPSTIWKVRLSPSASVALRLTVTLPLSSSMLAEVAAATGGVLRGGMMRGVWPEPQGGRVMAPVAVVTQRFVAVSPGTRR